MELHDRVILSRAGQEVGGTHEPQIGATGIVIDISESSWDDEKVWVTVSWDEDSFQYGDERYSDSLGEFFDNCWAVPKRCLDVLSQNPEAKKERVLKKVKVMWERQTFVKSKSAKTSKKKKVNKVEEVQVPVDSVMEQIVAEYHAAIRRETW